MQVRDQNVAPIPNRWLKLVNIDGSGLDAYASPNSIGGVIIEEPNEPFITVYMSGLMTAVKKGKSTELQDVWAEMRGEEARQFLAWLDQHTGVVVTASWTRRPPPSP